MVYLDLDVVEMLDISAIEDVIQSKDARGERPYNPRMMVALLIYAYCTGIYSSRKIARATYEQVAVRVLTGGQHPYFMNINALRKRHLAAFRELFKHVLVLCQHPGLLKLGWLPKNRLDQPFSTGERAGRNYSSRENPQVKSWVRRRGTLGGRTMGAHS